jgi:hypothetical protein
MKVMATQITIVEKTHKIGSVSLIGYILGCMAFGGVNNAGRGIFLHELEDALKSRFKIIVDKNDFSQALLQMIKEGMVNVCCERPRDNHHSLDLFLSMKD